MSKKYLVLFLAVLTTMVSCSKKEKFPSLNSEKTALKSVVLSQPLLSGEAGLPTDSTAVNPFSSEIERLFSYRNYYQEKNEKFDLDELQGLWKNLQPKIEFSQLPENDLEKWIDINGFLVELTGKAEYSEELERIIFLGSKNIENTEFENLFLPYVFTKDVDYIHVNLFANASLQYEHSFFGNVKITQETNYPASGSVHINFSLEEAKYVELYIRIPDWAEGATVNALNVKYLAPPGSYCKIAKKWKEGDWVKIEFPVDKMPAYLKF